MLHRENLKKIIQDDHFRVALFGSARIKSEDIRYQEISEFARHIAIKGYDIVTGGGP
jgi:predicted Rossmann-fold nucleotide-binding protein